MKNLFKHPSCLLYAITLCITLFSCQKNGDDAAPDEPKVSSKDPQTLSAAVSVWHGNRTIGALPAPSSTAEIKLGVPGKSLTTAIAGQLAFIRTKIETGNVAGYYVQIDGSGEYFKVDYTKPINVQNNTQQGSISTASERQIGQASESTSEHRSPISVMGSDDNFNDSIIVINIPANIKTPDTVCITYMAYDFNNHVSNAINVCINIQHAGDDNNSKWMDGTWSLTKLERRDGNELKDAYNYVYNKWIVAGEEALWTFNYIPMRLYQSGDSLIFAHYRGHYIVVKLPNYPYNVEKPYIPYPTDVLLATDSVIYKKHTFTFNGSKVTNNYSISQKFLYWTNTTWGLEEHSRTDLENGYWSYDPTTKHIISIFEYGDYGSGQILNPYMTDALLEKASDNQFTLSVQNKAFDGKTYTYVSFYQRQ